MKRLSRFGAPWSECACCLVALTIALAGCGGTSRPAVEETATVAEPSAAELAFRDALNEPPDGWSGPVFSLSHDYPASPPSCDAPWLARDVRFDDSDPEWNAEWEGYVMDVFEYVIAGQDPNLPNEIGWRTEVDGSTRWYHIPWMAYDEIVGREFVHGLTNEVSTPLSKFTGRGGGTHTLPTAKLVDGKEPSFETWSVGFYNPCGAWSVGQGWPADGAPATYTDEAGRLFASGLPFPEGTVVAKVLNTTASGAEVSFLQDSSTWQANAHVQTGPSTYDTCRRRVRDVHLVQIDLAVVDERSPTRWVYTTMVYNGMMNAPTVLSRMQPLGVQWGSDADTFAAVSREESQPLTESIANPAVNIFEHLGCGGRLAGPVDNSESSCISCHMGAYSAAPGVVQVMGGNVPAIFSFDGMCEVVNDDNRNYFSDYRYPDPYPGGAYDEDIPLDSSLQLQVAFAQYAYYKNPEQRTTCTLADAAAGG